MKSKMSHTKLQGLLVDGSFMDIAEYKNSWLFAPYVWNHMSRKYLDMEHAPIGDKEQMQHIWDLSTNVDIPEYERITLLTTFDYAMVKATDIWRIKDAYLEFTRNALGDNHLISMCMDIKSMMIAPRLTAICWTATSIVGDMWRTYESEQDEHRFYDMQRDTKHWFLFDTVAENNE